MRTKIKINKACIQDQDPLMIMNNGSAVGARARVHKYQYNRLSIHTVAMLIYRCHTLLTPPLMAIYLSCECKCMR